MGLETRQIQGFSVEKYADCRGAGFPGGPDLILA
jgi:hypothetical protein